MLYSFRSGIDFRRQNLTSKIDPRVESVRTGTWVKGHIYKCHVPFVRLVNPKMLASHQARVNSGDPALAQNLAVDGLISLLTRKVSSSHWTRPYSVSCGQIAAGQLVMPSMGGGI